MTRMTSLLLAALIAVPMAAQTPAAPSKPRRPSKAAKGKTTKPVTITSPGEWLFRRLNIDVAALAGSSRPRGDDSPESGERLAVYDRTTGVETTLWECGACWSPAPARDGILTLRRIDHAPAELWLVPEGGEPRRVAAVPEAFRIAGLPNGERALVGVRDGRCAHSAEGPFAIVEIALANGRVSDIASSPCFGSVSLIATQRLRSNAYLDTTVPNDPWGNRHAREIVVVGPADSDAPTAEPFDERLAAPPGRFDPAWLTNDRIVYVVKP